MNSNNNRTRLQNNNTPGAAMVAIKELKLYNLLFAGKITMKEYLRLLSHDVADEQTKY